MAGIRHRCTVKDCDRYVKSRSLCQLHLRRVIAAGIELPDIKRRKNRGDLPSSDPERQRYSRLWSKYRLRSEDWNNILLNQNGGCAVCGSTVDLCVDHDHSCCPGAKSCGKCIRGILCRACNNALGLARENPEVYSK